MKSEYQNLWWATAGHRPAAPLLEGSERADVVVVGAGIMGASAALRLAEAGTTVALIEAGLVGAGASSQPGGFVVPHFSVGSPAEIVARVGEVGERLVEIVGRSAAHVFETVRRLGIDCDARQGGWYQPAHSGAAESRVRDVAAQWTAFGFPVELLDGEATEARTGAAGYRASWYAPSGGTLHPLLYCRGLVDRAIERGARLFEHSRVQRIERIGGNFRVHAGGGYIDAARVILCTNGLSQELVPALAATIVPLRVWQCATQPLDPAERAHLFRDGECLSDTRRNLFTYRFDRDWRLITGALDAFGISGAQSGAAMARRLQQMLGLSRTPSIEYLWMGVSAVSAPRLPATLVTRDGLIAASSCNARGIALSTVVGEALGDFALGGPLPPIPMLGATGGRFNVDAQRRLSRLYPHFAPLLDWLDTRGWSLAR